MTFPYKEVVLGLSWTIFGFEQYLAYRQHVRLADPSLGVPALLRTEITDEEHIKSKAYGRDKSTFEFAANLFGQVITTATLVFDWMPLYWSWAASVLQHYGMNGDREILQSIAFVIISSAIGTAVDIPFGMYKQFVIEERYGFNKMDIPLFMSDKFKTFILTSVIAAPVVAAMLQIIKWGGDNFFFYVWMFMLVFQITMILLYPTVIAPMFNKFTPLEEGKLKTMIGELAARVHFPLTKVFVIDGSKRSSHSNAYFTGLFKDKRIVLFDTLLQQMTNNEICAVLAHELGHWSSSHIFRTLMLSQIQLFSIFYTFSHFIKSVPMYRAFGFETEPVMIGLVLFTYLNQPMDSIFSFVMHYVSRVHEFQADAYAKKLGYGEDLKSGLIKLNKKNLGNLIPDSWYSAYHYSHPPVVESHFPLVEYQQATVDEEDGGAGGDGVSGENGEPVATHDFEEVEDVHDMEEFDEADEEEGDDDIDDPEEEDKEVVAMDSDSDNEHVITRGQNTGDVLQASSFKPLQ
ncbi:CAAX prenyl protease 1 [Chytriomyces hyalinus]|nr:CAAX prenyl protease 1 [Chytriomyces hyalinus]